MSDPILCMYNEDITRKKEALPIEGDEHTTLSNDLEKILMAAQPRLARLAHAHGVPPDGIEDVIQETFVNAWQNLAYLRAPDRFEAWLNGICRNVSMRWTRAQGTADRRQRSFSSLQPVHESDVESCTLDLDVPDPQGQDLAEELNRQDLAVLLDRAMDHLPATARQALEMHYLADMPQREVALHLGMTINALEVKLHRARRQLRQVLQSELRADAESFGLMLDHEMTVQRWRETSIWCFLCGRRRLQGLFEPQQGGDVGLRLHCPTCSPLTGGDVVNTGTIVSLGSLRSFRPAFKQVLQALAPFYAHALATGYQRCPYCKNLASFRGIEPDEPSVPCYQRFSIILECAICGKIPCSIISLYLTYIPVSQFIKQHERCVIEPEELIEYEGQAAIRIGLRDHLSAADLTLILHRHTLQVLALFQH